MSTTRHLLLDAETINRKLRRMAFEIWERSSEETELTFIGIQQGGLAVAHCLAAALREVSGIKVEVMPMRLDKRDPVRNPPKLDADLSRKSVVLVDDVANSGKTLFYALGPLTPFKLRSVLIAVLVDRKHKAFPITPDVVGHALSTTLQDHIEVEADGDKVLGAYLH